MPIPQQKIDAWRQLISRDRLEKAITELSASVKDSSLETIQSWRNSVIGLESDFRINEQRHNDGERTGEDYQAERAKLRRRTLELLDALEAGRAYPKPKPVASSGGNRWPIFILALVGVGALAWWLWPREENVVVPEPLLSLCPEFDVEADFRAMVLPYEAANRDNRNPTLHRQVSGMLQSFAEEQDVSLDAEAVNLSIDEINQETGYPGGPADADDLGQDCNTQLVIWGYTEKDANDYEITLTEYRFIESEEWMFSEYQLDENMQIAKATTFTELVTSGQLTTEIEDALRLIFGLVARNMQNDEATIAFLENHPVNPTEREAFELQQLALADAYYNEGQEDEAEQAYTELIEQDSSNLLAWRNRGAIRYDQEKFDDAASDMSVVLSYEPGDEQARYTRALANIRADRIFEAELDLDRLYNQPQVTTPETEGAGAQNPDGADRDRPAEVQNHRVQAGQLRVLSEQLEQKRSETTIIRDRGRAALGSNSTDVRQLEAGMVAAYSLGDLSLAGRLAERVTQLQPDNVQAYQIGADAYLEAGDQTNANRVIQRAEARGLNSQLRIRRPLRLQRTIQVEPVEAEQIQRNQ